jgi:hypothetical protein
MHGHKTVFNPSFSNTVIPEFSAAFIIEPVPLLAKGIPSSLYAADTVSPSATRRANLTAKALCLSRLPSPASEEPKTAEEWDRFFARKDGALDRLLLIYEAGTRKFASN